MTLSALYEWMIEQLLISTSGLSGKQLSSSDPKTNWTIDDKIQHAQKIAQLTKEIQTLQHKIYKEKQFNKQVKMNLVLQKLRQALDNLTRTL
ncbi:DUF4391 domain-containing protein [Moraxella nasibovis]|uniref:DUF4391 domain-containing protein n=1 Tax=Moraxella nasibovis TaxID=2904120 RepID=UPI00240FFEF9|nr:DUF4391 domain-containing protein [Moraxella nasibovis]WFF38313.1 DUF4391 domain-containing protein [Moraxella nasibovis]